MKVWIVMYNDYEDTQPYEVCKTEARAQAIADERNNAIAAKTTPEIAKALVTKPWLAWRPWDVLETELLD